MKLRWIAPLVLCVFALLMVGCSPITDLLNPKPDLTVKSVEPLKDAGGVLTGVRMVIANTGNASASDVKYCVCLTSDKIISLTNDPEIYDASISSLAAGAEKQIDLDGTKDINPWMTSSGNDYSSISSTAKYYIGVMVDPSDTVDEKSETNNEGVTDTTFLMGGGGPQPGGSITVSGNMNIPAGLIASDWNPVSGGSYTVYVGALPSNFSGSSLPADANPADFFVAGYTHITASYDPAVTNSYAYSITVPSNGSYTILAFVDVNSDGKLNMIDSAKPPKEPIGTTAAMDNGVMPTISINGDATGVNLNYFMDVSGFSFVEGGGSELFKISGQVNPTIDTINTVPGVVHVAVIASNELLNRQGLILDPVHGNYSAGMEIWYSNPTGPLGSWPGDTLYNFDCYVGGYFNIVAWVDTNNDDCLSFDSSGNPLEPATGYIPHTSAQLYISGHGNYTGPSLYNF